jgi:hypothetical protein
LDYFKNMKIKDKKLWLRNMDCGHSRPTNLAFLSGNYIKPKVGTKCYCRECWKECKIVSVEELK